MLTPFRYLNMRLGAKVDVVVILLFTLTNFVISFRTVAKYFKKPLKITSVLDYCGGSLCNFHTDYICSPLHLSLHVSMLPHPENKNEWLQCTM